jgi:hypothetical protein
MGPEVIIVMTTEWSVVSRQRHYQAARSFQLYVYVVVLQSTRTELLKIVSRMDSEGFFTVCTC